MSTIVHVETIDMKRVNIKSFAMKPLRIAVNFWVLPVTSMGACILKGSKNGFILYVKFFLLFFHFMYHGPLSNSVHFYRYLEKWLYGMPVYSYVIIYFSFPPLIDILIAILCLYRNVVDG